MSEPERCTCKDVPAGTVFKYADDNELLQQSQFIKLNGKRNVVAVATWTATVIDDDASVIILGTLDLKLVGTRSTHSTNFGSKTWHLS